MASNMIRPNLVIYYHSPCSDGHAAAWAINTHLGKLDKYNPITGKKYNIIWKPSVPGCPNIGIEIPLIITPNSDVLFLDLMPSYDILYELCMKCDKVIVLDHHKTNMDICSRIQPENNWSHNLEIVFDMTRAGCQIAWDWITAKLPESNGMPLARPWFLEYIADRDLWTWRLPNSKLINSALFGLKLTTTPDTIAEKLAIVRTPKQQEEYIAKQLIPYALAAEEFNNELLRTACAKANDCLLTIPTTGQTYRVWLGTIIGSLRSDLGNQLCNKPFADGSLPDLSASWHYEFPANEWWISLRSLDTGADVSAICKEFGGGGHMRAAGFTIRAPDNLGSVFKCVPASN